MAFRGERRFATVRSRPRNGARAGGTRPGARNTPLAIVRWFRRLDQRGQSLVEFALILPAMLLLALIALDFGRVYLGWINLQNMARSASNFAANNADAWIDPSDPTNAAIITEYRNQAINDA